MNYYQALNQFWVLKKPIFYYFFEIDCYFEILRLFSIVYNELYNLFSTLWLKFHYWSHLCWFTLLFYLFGGKFYLCFKVQFSYFHIWTSRMHMLSKITCCQTYKVQVNSIFKNIFLNLNRPPFWNLPTVFFWLQNMPDGF